MWRLQILALLAIGGIGGWYFFSHYEIEGLEHLDLKPRALESEGGTETGRKTPDGKRPLVQVKNKSIRVATANLGPLDLVKLSKPHVLSRLVELIHQFDVVAVQDVRGHGQVVLAEFVQRINSGGRHYSYAMSGVPNHDPAGPSSAFLFDHDTVEIGRGSVYFVEDQAGRFRREPLVGSFIARGPDVAEAFTFTLINVYADPDRASMELDLLDDVFRAVRDNRDNEDDVILLGDFGADYRHLGQLGLLPDITWLISGQPTTTRGTRSTDNIVFDARATREFTGRSGLVDLIGQFQLSMREALEISDHLPVWAEFSVYEGGEAGYVAGRQGGQAAR